LAGKIGPEYQRLMDQIRSMITSGEYPVGTMIPSTAELKEMTGMSVPVVRRAVGQLEADGVLEGHPGKGVYVKATPDEVASERGDTKALSERITALSEEVRQLREVVDSLGVEEVRAIASRIEVNLIDLYGKIGFDYPRDEAEETQREGTGTKAAAKHGRIA
jgi:DNA-binding GntR family transcriptional regulator